MNIDRSLVIIREGSRTRCFRIIACLSTRDVPPIVVAFRFDLRCVSRIHDDVRGCSWILVIHPRFSKFRASLPCTVLGTHHGSRPSLRVGAETRSSIGAFGIQFAKSTARYVSRNNTPCVGIPELPFEKHRGRMVEEPASRNTGTRVLLPRILRTAKRGTSPSMYSRSKLTNIMVSLDERVEREVCSRPFSYTFPITR